jgi:hypothetical protein
MTIGDYPAWATRPGRRNPIVPLKYGISELKKWNIRNSSSLLEHLDENQRGGSIL